MKHIVNGECLKDYFLSQNLVDGEMFSFNELFVEGPLLEKIFSPVFMERRAQYLHKTYNIQLDVIHEKNKDMLAVTEFEQDGITLWFDQDVYCQINLLVLLAYFSQSKKQNHLIIKLIPQQFSTINSLQDNCITTVNHINIAEANLIYLNLLVNKKYDQLLSYGHLELFSQLPALKKALTWYIELQHSSNDLTKYINHSGAMPEDDLIKKLFTEYHYLGLTDMQYSKLIRKVRAI